MIALSATPHERVHGSGIRNCPGRGNDCPVHRRYLLVSCDHDDHGDLQRCEQDRNAGVRQSNSDWVDLRTQPGHRR